MAKKPKPLSGALIKFTNCSPHTHTQTMVMYCKCQRRVTLSLAPQSTAAQTELYTSTHASQPVFPGAY